MPFFKGIDYHPFVSTNPLQLEIAIRGHDDHIHDADTADTPTHHYAEIHSDHLRNIKLFRWKIPLEWSGRFQFKQRQDRNSQYADINPYTGNIRNGTLNNFLDNPPQKSTLTTADGTTIPCILNYGFYQGSITANNQAYAYLTRDDNHAWMGDLIAANPEFGDLPFSLFALPGSHDCAMYLDVTAEMVDNMLHYFEEYTCPEILSKLFDVDVKLLHRLPRDLDLEFWVRGLRNVSLTQKDNTTVQLELGTRYFDYRPGYHLWKNGQGGLFHQHAAIPGDSIEKFIGDLITFLEKYPSEIAVVDLTDNGFVTDAMKPSETEVRRQIDALVNGRITLGDQPDLTRSYNDLIATNTRLILMWETGFNQSYDSKTYKTTEVAPIIGALNDTRDRALETGKPNMFQLQSTANGVAKCIVRAFLNKSDTTSVLVMTKGAFDTETYRWANELDPADLGNLPVFFINDFVDSALPYICRQLSQKRFDHHLANNG